MQTDFFEVDGVQIATPTQYKPIFATTSTDDSDRTQDLVMHNTPIGTVAGYDLVWKSLRNNEISTILNGMMDKSKFSFHHKSPLSPNGWMDADFYATNFNMGAQRLQDGEELWTDLSISVRSIDPV